MPEVAVGAAALLLVVAAFVLPVRWGLALAVGCLLVVPPVLVVPNGYTSLPTVDRLVVLSLGAGLVARVLSGRLPAAVFAPSRVHAAFVLFLSTAAATGVWAAGPQVRGSTLASSWALLAELAVVFVVFLAAVRAAADPRFVVAVLAAAVGVSAGIGVVEHLTGASWGHWLFAHLRSQQGQDAAAGLESRAGATRVRAGAEFALQFGWTTVALVPALLAVLARRRAAWRPAAVAGLVLALLALYWSYTRSALVGVAAGALLLAAVARVRLLAVVCAVGAAALAAAYLAAPGVAHHFSAAVDQGSVDSRIQRLPIVLGLVTGHSWTGLGLGALGQLGRTETDSSYLHRYAEIGALGVAAFALLLLTALWVAASAARSGDPDSRVLGGVALAGLGVLLLSAVAMDTFELAGTSWLFMLFAACGVAASPSAGRVVALRRPAPRLVVWPALLTGAAAVVWGAWPSASAQTFRFDAVPAADEASAAATYQFGPVLANTLCGVAQGASPAHVVCATDATLGETPGTGWLRVQARSPGRVRSAEAAIARSVRAALDDPELRVVVATPLQTGVPAAVRTAPGWVALVAFGLVVLHWPLRRLEAAAGPRAG